MKKLLAFAVVAVVVVGIVKVVSARSPEGKAKTACENMAKVCDKFAKLSDEKFTSDDIDECSSDLGKKGREFLGEDKFNEMVSCMADADTCGEAIGCMGGSFMNEMADEIEGFGKGFERTLKKR